MLFEQIFNETIKGFIYVQMFNYDNLLFLCYYVENISIALEGTCSHFC